MTKIIKGIVVLLCSITPLITSSVHAEDVIRVVRTVQFGKVIFHPGGDTVTIDASDGSTSSSLVEKGKLLSGGQSGLLTIKASTEAVVQITYPHSITLRHQHNGPDLVVDDIREYSEHGDSVIDHPGNEEEIRVNIGGKLIINRWALEGSYQGHGNIFIEITYL